MRLVSIHVAVEIAVAFAFAVAVAVVNVKSQLVVSFASAFSKGYANVR